ncbi:MAG: esterase [Burkholderiaceae bacterium]
MAKQADLPDPFIFIPKTGKPELLFVLLHGESADPEQLFPLAEAIKRAFPRAMVMLPYAFENAQAGGQASEDWSDIEGYHWISPVGLSESNYAERVARALPPLVEQVKRTQAAYGLTGQQTALAGFSQGASMALEASHATPDLAGRVLAFSGLYAALPDTVPPTTMLHFFHGAGDQQVSVNDVESTLVRLGELQGDATLDVASRIGHELHEALIKQAIVRLQTCVPLRNWEDALGSLQEQGHDDAPVPARPAGRTLH